MIRRSLPLLASLFALGFVCSTALAAQVVDLGTLGGTFSAALDINDRNQVVFQARLTGDLNDHIALWDRGTVTDISELYGLGVGYNAWGNAINNRSEIAILSPAGTAAVLSRGQVLDLGFGTYSEAFDVNNGGQVVGYYNQPSGLPRAFLVANGNTFLLGPSDPLALSVSVAINNLGVVIGYVADSVEVLGHGFVYNAGVTTNLAPFGYTENYASAINNLGDIVGWYWSPQQEAFTGFICKDGVYQTLGPEIESSAINDRGQVVGTMTVHVSGQITEQHAFIYWNGVLTDLNDLVPGSGWRLEWAYSINQQGNMVGFGVINGETHGFLLKP